MAQHRGDVDDRPAAARDHPLGDALGDKKAAAQIGVEDAVVILRRDLEETAGHRHPGVVDQNVEGGEGVLNLGHRRLDSGAVGDVQRHGEGRPPRAWISPAKAASLSVCRAAKATAAPWAARTSAKRRPSPCEAPVTKAVLPVKSNSSAIGLGLPVGLDGLSPALSFIPLAAPAAPRTRTLKGKFVILTTAGIAHAPRSWFCSAFSP